MTMNPDEIATLEVNGKVYTDWTSVVVEVRWVDWFPTFMFENTEESPVPINWSDLQFLPGDVVKISLANVPSVFGYITERHAGYSDQEHGIKLIGTGRTSDLTNSTVPLDKLGNHDGKTWPQLAKDLMAHLGIGLTLKGKVDTEPFEQIQVQPGETIATILERYARMRKIVIGSNEYGDLLAIGNHSAEQSGILAEGVNIRAANCVIRDDMVYRRIYTMGQKQGNDDSNGDQANKQIGQVIGSSNRNRFLVIPTEIADSDAGVQKRAEMEYIFTEGAQIEAHVTVQGWLQDGGKPWRAGEYYWVRSPSLVLDRLLGCRTAVYRQHEGGGTTTTLEMVDPVHMNGKPDYRT